jgi:CHAD domain-containing protein
MMQEYVRKRAATLLRRLAFRLNRAAKLRDADSIHDLRVAIRRFEQCLRIFHAFFPKSHQKKIRRRLRKIMDLSGGVRNRDIALDLLRKAGVPDTSAISVTMLQDRKQAQQALLRELDRWGRRDLSKKWGARLGL